MGHPARGGPAGHGRGFRAGDCHCLVLCAVFVPTAFMAGISGEFFRQFALTIAASTIISAFNSLTLSPGPVRDPFQGARRGARARAHGHAKKEAMPRLGVVLIVALLAYFMLTPVPGSPLGRRNCPAGMASTAADAHASSAALWAFGLVSLAAGAAAGVVPGRIG